MFFWPKNHVLQGPPVFSNINFSSQFTAGPSIVWKSFPWEKPYYAGLYAYIVKDAKSYIVPFVQDLTQEERCLYFKINPTYHHQFFKK